MEDKEITTLHPFLNRDKNRYPNVKDENIPDSIQRKLTPGDGIKIDEDNVISATATEVDAYTKEESDAKYATKTEYDNLNKVMPTDITYSNGFALEHDGEVISGQDSKVKLGENLNYDPDTKTINASGGTITLPIESHDDDVIINANLTKEYEHVVIAQSPRQQLTLSLINIPISYETQYSLLLSNVLSIRPAINNINTMMALAFSHEFGSSANLLLMPYSYNVSGNIFLPKVNFSDRKNALLLCNYDFKSITLFGNYTITSPSDSSAPDNIDLYHHDIVITSEDKRSVIYLSKDSSSNLVVDSITDLNTLLKTQERSIQVSGTRTADGASLPISSIDWKGTFVGSNYTWTDPTNEEDNEPLSTAFGSGTIKDVVTTL